VRVLAVNDIEGSMQGVAGHSQTGDGRETECHQRWGMSLLL